MYNNRQKNIMQHLAEVKFARVDQLAELFNVSIETIRRDLLDLEKEGSIQRIRGGAIYNKLRAKEIEFEKKLEENQLEKIAIAKLACEYINDGDAIGLSNGSCNVALAKHLAETKKNLTVITNSPDIAYELNENQTFSVLITGGNLRKHNNSLVGYPCIEFLNAFNLDKALINIDGLSIKDGVTEYNQDERAVIRKLLSISHTKMILTESSVFGIVALNRVCQAEEIDYIFTDWAIQQREIKEWSNIGTRILTAKEWM